MASLTPGLHSKKRGWRRFAVRVLALELQTDARA